MSCLKWRRGVQLGACYAAGRGVGACEATAVRWWSEAARAGDEEARYALALCLHSRLQGRLPPGGGDGVEDVEKGGEEEEEEWSAVMEAEAAAAMEMEAEAEVEVEDAAAGEGCPVGMPERDCSGSHRSTPDHAGSRRGASETAAGISLAGAVERPQPTAGRVEVEARGAALGEPQETLAVVGEGVPASRPNTTGSSGRHELDKIRSLRVSQAGDAAAGGAELSNGIAKGGAAESHQNSLKN